MCIARILYIKHNYLTNSEGDFHETNFLALSVCLLIVNFQLLATTIPASNVTNQCSCSFNGSKVTCTRTSANQTTINFGVYSDGAFHPQLSLTPGSSGNAPISNVVGAKTTGLGVIMSYGAPVGKDTVSATLQDIGNPSRLVVLPLSYQGKTGYGPLNSKCINLTNCTYSNTPQCMGLAAASVPK